MARVGERWAIRGTVGVSRAYLEDPKKYFWTRNIKRIKWFASSAEAERSFDHSMWVVVPESAVVADLVQEELHSVQSEEAQEEAEG